MSKIGLLHPGQMGVSIGAALVAGEHSVCWLSAARSPATRTRAEDAGFMAVTSLPELVRQCDAIVSVCPPEAAITVAEQVAALNNKILYVDANAVAPQTASIISSLFVDNYVDGGIIGPPAISQGSTRLYLSGPLAKKVAAWFAGSAVEAVALEGGLNSASMLKMCYAAYTKGHAALLANVRGLALAGEVEAELFAEWQLSQPGLESRSAATLVAVAPKAWRFKAEMDEIAATFRHHHLPDGFHRGASEIYQRLQDFKDSAECHPDEIVRKLTSPH